MREVRPNWAAQIIGQILSKAKGTFQLTQQSTISQTGPKSYSGTAMAACIKETESRQLLTKAKNCISEALSSCDHISNGSWTDTLISNQLRMCWSLESQQEESPHIYGLIMCGISSPMLPMSLRFQIQEYLWSPNLIKQTSTFCWPLRSTILSWRTSMRRPP